MSVINTIGILDWDSLYPSGPVGSRGPSFADTPSVGPTGAPAEYGYKVYFEEYFAGYHKPPAIKYTSFNAMKKDLSLAKRTYRELLKEEKDIYDHIFWRKYGPKAILLIRGIMEDPYLFGRLMEYLTILDIHGLSLTCRDFLKIGRDYVLSHGFKVRDPFDMPMLIHSDDIRQLVVYYSDDIRRRVAYPLAKENEEKLRSCKSEINNLKRLINEKHQGIRDFLTTTKPRFSESRFTKPTVRKSLKAQNINYRYQPRSYKRERRQKR